jgi:hypothetical protein
MELFRSERRFKYWAHTVSHSQTLFRTETLFVDGVPPAKTRIDLQFKPTSFLKIRNVYDGLIVRTPTEAEAERIRREVGKIRPELSDHPVVLESADGVIDYIVTLAFGWAEDHGLGLEPSTFAGPLEHEGPPWTRRSLFGVDGGMQATATPEQLAAALTTSRTTAATRDSFRPVWVLMRQHTSTAAKGIKAQPVGIFLSREEAEHEQQRQIALHPTDQTDWWIESSPIAV